MFDPKTIPDHIFRGYDLRGLAEKELSSEVFEYLGKGYATFLKKRRINQAVVGMDNRLTSQNYKDSLVKGLLSCGVEVIDFGLGLAQIMYFAQYLFRTKGGAFITASHNPKEYNGLKLAVGFSQTMVSEEIQEFRQITQSGDYHQPEKPGTYQEAEVFPDYKNDILSRVKVGRKYKVVVDACNGPAGKFLPEILREAGCQVIEQNTDLDGNFPNGTPDPTEKKVQQRLADRVLKEKADIGFSYDSDGDRVGVVDEKGSLIWNDTLVSIFSLDVLDYLPGSKIIFNTLCSRQVPEVIKKAGGIPVMWLTGHSYIKEKVAEERAPFGGELSGHFFFLDNFYGHDDGAFSSLRLLAYLSRKNQTLGQAVSQLPFYLSSPEIKLGCPDNLKIDLVGEKIKADLKSAFPEAEFFTLEGVRLETPETMVIIRASQNGPYLTLKFEAKNDKIYQSIKEKILKIVKKYPEIDLKSGINLDSLLS